MVLAHFWPQTAGMTDNATPAPAAPSPAAPSPAAQDQPVASQAGKAIGLMLAGVAIFSMMDVLVKWQGAIYPVVLIMFFRSLFALLPLSVFVFRDGLGNALRVKSPVGHVVRSLMGLAAMGAIFVAYTQMRLADVVAITFAAPIFVTALSVPLLGEKVGLRRWSAISVGFIGVLVIVQPGPSLFDSAAMIALAGTVFYALASIFVRKLSKTDPATAIVFYFTLTSTLVTGALLPFVWVTPSLPDLAMLIAIGIIGGVAQLTKTQAFRYADVAVIMPFDYTALIWATLYGYLFWDEFPAPMTLLGAAIVIGSGLYILLRESNLGLTRGAARRLQTKR